MFIIELLANDTKIERIRVRNTGRPMVNGQIMYRIEETTHNFFGRPFIWHEPADGAIELARKILDRLKKVA